MQILRIWYTKHEEGEAMKKQERQAKILAILKEKGEIHTSTLCREFDIVEMTIRRDFMEMERRKEIIRTHGGAIAVEKKVADVDTPLTKRLTLYTKEKEQIAGYAKTLLKQNDHIFLASGSTIQILAKSLLHYIPLVIVSDAINIATTLYEDPRLSIYMLGGELKSNAFTLTGAIAENNLRQFRLDKAFISVNGMDEEGQLYTSSVVESKLLELLFHQVNEVYVLLDASKFYKKDFVAIHTDAPYTIISDAHPNASLLEQLNKRHITLKSV